MSLWVLPTQPELTYIRRQYGDIMISTSLLTGATLYVGYKTYRAAQRAAQPAWWRGVMARLDKLRTAMGGERQAATVVPVTHTLYPVSSRSALPTSASGLAFARFEPPTAKQSLGVAVTALGTAMTAVLYYPPLRLVSIPAFLYLGIAPTHRVYVIWRQEGRFSPLAAESVLLAFCLVQGYFLVGAVGFSLYYLGQVMAEAKRQVPDARSTWQPPVWAWRQSAEGEVVTPVNCLQVGDTVVVHAGEMVPLAGIVSSGTAWVRTPESTTHRGADEYPVGIKISVGQAVAATTIVMVGAIGVVINPLPSA